MASYDYGKDYIKDWVKANFDKGATCLDVGACDGKWHKLLGDYLDMSACEIFNANVVEHNLADKYSSVYVCDIADYKYKWYDLIIFGDVIEHMSIDKAKAVIDYALDHSKDIIVGVPFLYPQGEIYGNPYEKHIQDDLTDAVFRDRYGLEVLHAATEKYFYYHSPLIQK